MREGIVRRYAASVHSLASKHWWCRRVEEWSLSWRSKISSQKSPDPFDEYRNEAACVSRFREILMTWRSVSMWEVVSVHRRRNWISPAYGISEPLRGVELGVYRGRLPLPQNLEISLCLTFESSWSFPKASALCMLFGTWGATIASNVESSTFGLPAPALLWKPCCEHSLWLRISPEPIFCKSLLGFYIFFFPFIFFALFFPMRLRS